MNVLAGQESLDPIADRTRRRITLRLAPFLFILYVFNYWDRVNVSYAALEMTGDLGFSNAVFGFGAGIFFIGYFLLQIPQTLLVEKWSARKFIGVTLICWGGLATLTGLITTAHQFYWIRFFLGIAEAGFFPGIIVYLTHWYRNQDRAKAVALFMLGIPISNMLGAGVAAFLIRIHWLGYRGWRWLLILEGFPAVIAGIVTFFYLTDRPKDARWLTSDEREWITGELEREKNAKGARKPLNIWKAMRERNVILLAGAYFCYITNSVGLGTWLPKIVQRISGLSTFHVILISGIPWLAAIPAMLLSGWHSDKTGERRWHTALPIFAVGVALAISQWAGNHLILAMAAFSIATMALYAFPLAVLGAADGLWQRHGGRGQHRFNQFDRKPGRICRALCDRISQGQNRHLCGKYFLSGGLRRPWRAVCFIPAAWPSGFRRQKNNGLNGFLGPVVERSITLVQELYPATSARGIRDEVRKNHQKTIMTQSVSKQGECIAPLSKAGTFRQVEPGPSTGRQHDGCE